MTTDLDKGGTPVQRVRTNYGPTRGWEMTDAAELSDTTLLFSTVASVQAATVESSTTNIFVTGYASAGDGGAALYKRVNSAPSHPAKIQSADGVWWELCSATLDARSLGAKFDSSTDDTTAINNAITAAVALGVWLELPAGTSMVSQITVPSNLRMRGIPGKTILKRTATATETWLIDCGTSTGFILEGFDVDGNKALNSHAVTLILVAGGDFKLRRMRLRNAKSSGGYGTGLLIVNTTDDTDGTRSYVSEIETFDCDGQGILAYHCSFIDFDMITDDGSGDGFYLGSYANPVESDTCSDIRASRIRSTGNARNGVTLFGQAASGFNGSTAIFDATAQQVHRVLLSDIVVDGCGGYGVAIQGADVTASHISASNCYAGVLFNAYRSSLTDFETNDNTTYGIDAGGSVDCVISGHRSRGNAIGANLGGQQRCVYSDFETYDCDTHIGTQKYESGGGGAFPLSSAGHDVTIANGAMRGGGTEIGIYARQAITGLVVEGVRASGFASGKDFVFETQERKFVGCTTDRDTGVSYASLTAANELIISDCVDYYYLSGTTAIQRILTQTQSTFRGKISAVKTNAAGAGGWTPGAQYTITFTGDGSGAAGYVEIAQDGYAGPAVITNTGSGYTTCTATVALSGVTLTVYVGLLLQDHGRQITFKCVDAVTFEYGLSVSRNIVPYAEANYAVPANTIVVFQNVYGAWQQVAPSVPASFDFPASVTIGGLVPIVGSVGAVNNGLVTANGTGGKTLQGATGATFGSGVFGLASAANYMPQFRVTNSADHASASYWYLTKNRGGGSINAGDPLGTMLFTGYDTGSVERYAAYIAVYGTSVGSGYIEGKMYFYVMNTSGTLAARMTLTATACTYEVSLVVNNTVNITNTTEATSSTTGAETVAGGLGVAKSVIAGLYLLTTSPTSGLGYGAGAGGTVAQATSKATSVTLNKVCGEITMNAAALAAATIVSFTLTNSAITATDTLVINHVSGGTLGAYSINAACGAGSAVIYVRNNTAGSLSEALVLRFALVKGATS